MIKLGFSFDISLSKFILSVAGISATVCGFQYFSSNKKQKRASLKIKDKYSADKESKPLCMTKNGTSKEQRLSSISTSLNNKGNVSTKLVSSRQLNRNTEVIDMSYIIVDTNINTVVTP